MMRKCNWQMEGLETDTAPTCGRDGRENYVMIIIMWVPNIIDDRLIPISFIV